MVVSYLSQQKMPKNECNHCGVRVKYASSGLAKHAYYCAGVRKRLRTAESDYISKDFLCTGSSSRSSSPINNIYTDNNLDVQFNTIFYNIILDDNNSIRTNYEFPIPAIIKNVTYIGSDNKYNDKGIYSNEVAFASDADEKNVHLTFTFGTKFNKRSLSNAIRIYTFKKIKKKAAKQPLRKSPVK